MNFKPIGNSVLVDIIKPDDETSTGIRLTPGSKEQPNKGKVLAIGVSVKDVQVDDIIVFSKFAGSDVNLDGKKYLKLNCDDIVGIILNKE